MINISTPREYLATYVTAAQMSQFFIDKVGFISAKAYGAKGDGVTDDTMSINAAIATAIANGNSMVYMPCGTYLNSGLSSDSTSITFVGDGSTFTGSTYPILDWAQLVDKGIVGNTSDFNASITNSTTIVSAINEIENELSTHIAHTSRHLTLMSSAGDMIYRKSTGAAILPIGTAYYTLGVNSGANAPQWVTSLQSLMTAKGDIVYASAANTPARLAKAANDGAILTQASDIPSWLAKGTAYQHLGMKSDASAPEWQASANSVLTAEGDMLYASGANTLARLEKGTAYQALQMNSGATAPEWVNSLASLLTTAGDTVYASANNTPARLAKGTAYQIKRMNSGATAPEWATDNNYVSASATILLSADTERSQNAVAEVTKKTFTVNLQGFYRVYFTSKLANWGGYGGSVKVYLNGVLAGTEPLNASDSTYAEHYINLPWAYAGSTIDIKLENGNKIETAYVKNCRVAGTVARIADAVTLD